VSPEYDDLYDSFAHARGERGRLPILPAAVNRELDATFDQRRFVYEARWDPEHEWMEIGFRARRAHAVSIQRLEIDVVFDEDEPLRVEISSKFRREQFELETAQAGLRVESWWTDRAGDFAVGLVLRDTSLGS
jgi:L-histidine N-alpha-methyltransferase